MYSKRYVDMMLNHIAIWSRNANRRSQLVTGLPLVAYLLLTPGQTWAQAEPPTSESAEAATASGRYWPGADFPLPLQVRTPEEMAFKAIAERNYLVFNLLTSGKIAFDQGNYDVAVTQWQHLLALEGVDAATRNAVAPLLKKARAESRDPAPQANQPGGKGAAPATAHAAPPAEATPPRTRVSGTISGGGRIGPGAAVVWLKRRDGATPSPRPGRQKVVNQKDKTFVPHVLAVPVGTEIVFRNDDDFYHNVFSISEPAKFDTGLYKSGAYSMRKFTKPGAVQLLCNIHSNMLAYIYVVDSPYYTQPNAQGVFSISGVPPGSYDLFAWHESSSGTLRAKIDVGPNGVRGIQVNLPEDLPPVVSLPDKYGKPRQTHLGY